ncbi:RidA family protein [Paraburkholderia sacchari]|uniref:RidA family protein n=1 Tax=Paraburkholderia sacchari TaxID=159450 RepID=UPI001F349A11|nr:hypothetical protein [Paraburkholderia sacchari]
MTNTYFAESSPVTRNLPRSRATKAGDLAFVSGQVARNEDGRIVTGTKIEIETIACRP